MLHTPYTPSTQRPNHLTFHVILLLTEFTISALSLLNRLSAGRSHHFAWKKGKIAQKGQAVFTDLHFSKNLK